METYPLTNRQARQLLLLRHGLIGPKRYQGKTGTLDYIRDIGSLQFDPIDICGRTADLTLHARVKHYRKADLTELLYHERHLIDYFDKNLSIYPIEDFSKFHYTQEHLGASGRKPAAIDAIRPLIFAAIREKDFVSAKDFDLNQKVPWDWGQNKLSRAALEYLYHSGELVIHHKDDTRKYYTLPERLGPHQQALAGQPFPAKSDFYTWVVQRRISNVGFLWNKASDAWLGIPGFKAHDRQESFAALLPESLIELQVAGIAEPLYLLKKDRPFLQHVLTTPNLAARLEFIPPLDALIWDRKLISALFDFDYKWEIYTPVAKRRYGHYVLPILYGDQFIGRIELKVKRQDRHLEVTNYWLEANVTLTQARLTMLNQALKRLARLNDCLTWESVTS